METKKQEGVNKNLELWEKWRAVPAHATKPFKLGSMGFTDINPVWRIKTITEAYGPCGIGWYTENVEHWSEQCGNEIAVFVRTKLYLRDGDGWSKPIEGVGGSTLLQYFKTGPKTNDEAYKMAETDALSVCCKKLGIAADIYFSKDARYETKYEKESILQNSQNTQQPTQEETLIQKAINAINASKTKAEMQRVVDGEYLSVKNTPEVTAAIKAKYYSLP